MTETKDLPTMSENGPFALIADRFSRNLGIEAGFNYMIPVELKNSMIIPSPATDMFKESIAIMFVPKDSVELLNDGIAVSYQGMIENLIASKKERMV